MTLGYPNLLESKLYSIIQVDSYLDILARYIYLYISIHTRVLLARNSNVNMYLSIVTLDLLRLIVEPKIKVSL